MKSRNEQTERGRRGSEGGGGGRILQRGGGQYITGGGGHRKCFVISPCQSSARLAAAVARTAQLYYQTWQPEGGGGQRWLSHSFGSASVNIAFICHFFFRNILKKKSFICVKTTGKNPLVWFCWFYERMRCIVAYISCFVSVRWDIAI